MKRSVRDVDVKGKRVLVREDLNVPLDPETGRITDDRRIQAAVPTLRYLSDQGARVIIVSHLGRPKGAPNDKLRLKPVAERLSAVLGKPVKSVSDTIGPEAEAAVRELKDGELLLLENVRFHKEEEKNDPEFAKKLASLAEIYVNDAFGAAHRAHGSTEGVAHHLPAVSGFLLQKELDVLGAALETPDRPFVTILGGAKVSDKINVIERLLEKADTLLIGGAMAYTFFLAQGKKVGKSLVEPDKVDLAKNLLEKAAGKIQLPIDTVVASEMTDTAQTQVVEGDIPGSLEGFDIGPRTIARYRDQIAKAKTIIWNGPMGVFEKKPFAAGTKAIAEAVAAATKTGAATIIGGGDSAAAIEQLGLSDQVSHVSTGGGASLEFLENGHFSTLDILQD